MSAGLFLPVTIYQHALVVGGTLNVDDKFFVAGGNDYDFKKFLDDEPNIVGELMKMYRRLIKP